VGTDFISAVAFYGTKSGPLGEMIIAIRNKLHQMLGDKFTPYTTKQTHSTLIRLDGVVDGQNGSFSNSRYRQVRGIARPMDPNRALDILQVSLESAIRIRFGGYESGGPATFSSQGGHPYDRMFFAPGNAFVLIGWPTVTVLSGLAEKPIDDLRRNMEAANVLHWYHQSPTDVDNDLHMVVGHHQGAASSEVSKAVTAIREYLAERPIEVDLGIDQVAVIVSESTTLAPAKFIGRIPKDSAEIIKLFA
jgi:hypothetical protein